MQSKAPRIQRQRNLQKSFARTQYRKALPALLLDFSNRCAYSMISLHLTSDVDKHIDHFDPDSKKRPRVYLHELLLCSSHCNIAKSCYKPTRDQRIQGLTLFNPTEETEYGVDIFEQAESGLLVGTTCRAKLHLIKLGLNAPHLLKLRKRRTVDRERLESIEFFHFKEPPTVALVSMIRQFIETLKIGIDESILVIPFIEVKAQP